MPDPTATAAEREPVGATVTTSTTDSQRERAQQMYDENPLRYASEASDHGWSVITGMCGGCGSDDCHDGPCHGVGPFDACDRCSNRRAQGVTR